jgi:putative ABC transport system substrate-binding protein
MKPGGRTGLLVARPARSVAGVAGLVVTLVFALVAAAPAQPASGLARVGILPLGSPSNSYDRSLVEGFRQGLRDAGLVEHRDVELDVVWVGGERDTARAVSELVQRGARLLVPCGTSASLAVKRHAPSTLPILFISVGNPVGIGLVESLTHPGGNVTGFSDVLADLSGKYVQFALELGKQPAALHYLWHNGWADGQNRLQATERAARSAGVKLRPVASAGVVDADDAMAAMKRAGAASVIVQPSPLTFQQRERLAAVALKHRLATIFAFPPAAREGALMAYGPDYGDLYRRAGASVNRILKGSKPADLPVEEPAKFELVVNLRTAQALGLTVPATLLLQATEIIR